MLHALEFRDAVLPEPGSMRAHPSLWAPARNGIMLLEVGYDLDERGRIVIVHPMPLRRGDHDATQLRPDRPAVGVDGRVA